MPINPNKVGSVPRKLVRDESNPAMTKQSTITQIKKKKATDYTVSRHSLLLKKKGYIPPRPADAFFPLPLFNSHSIFAAIWKYYAYHD